MVLFIDTSLDCYSGCFDYTPRRGAAQKQYGA
jgi:hypothetical protein